MNTLIGISLILAVPIQLVEQIGPPPPSPEIVVVEKSWSQVRYRPGWDRQIPLNREPNPTDPTRMERRRTGKPIEGYVYKTKVKNLGQKTVVLVGWDYVFTDSESKKQTSHQFHTRIKIAAGKKKELAQFTREPPTRTVNISSTITEEVIINYIEYEDGTVWRREQQ
jgi:hypothetical protein